MQRDPSIPIALFPLLFLIPLPLHAADFPRHAPHEILVKIRADRSARPIAAQWEGLARRTGVREEEPLLPAAPRRAAKPVSARADLEAVLKLRLEPGADPLEAARAYEASGLVEYAQPNRLYRTMEAPNDPRFAEQWNLPAVNWAAAWEATQRATIRKNPIIAIVDSGLDYRHEDLAPAVWINAAEANGKAGVDDDGNGYVDDIRGWDFTDAIDIPGSGDYLRRDNDPMDEGGHGTHVAGIAGAASNNGLGISGACPTARLMALRAGFTYDGLTYLEDDDLAAAIAYAVENGADVINASWGDEETSPVLRDAVRYAARNGVVFVAAAGNEGRPSLVYPAALGEAISVAALDSQGRLATFSSHGGRLDLAAPGVNILSTRVGGGYQYRSGTSQAAPLVAGLAAWMLAYRPEWAPEQVRAVLKRTATDLGAAGRDEVYGSGRPDAATALAAPSAPLVRLLHPPSGAGLSTDTEVTGLAAGGVADYRLEWGAGTNPASWTTIGQDRAAGTTQVLGRWRVAGLPDSTYTLRLTGRLSDGSTAEDRAVLTLDRTPPVFRWRRVAARLDSFATSHFVEWETDDPVVATVRILPAAGTERNLDAPYIARRQSVALPDDLPEGATTVRILARNGSGLASDSRDTTFLLRRETVSRAGYAEVATLPDGYLINRASDFDGNGRSEIALMPYLSGQAFGPVTLFEKGSDWQFRGVFTSAEAFLPWNVGDVLGDGRPQLMGATLGRVRLFEGPTPGAWPSATVLDDATAWGGDLADLDGDGKAEVVARSTRGTALRILKYNPSTRAFAEIAPLPNPTAGDNGIGPRYGIADFDGDGRPEILFGDSDGDLVVYERGDDGAYRNTWSMLGSPGSDARIVGGGEDLDGDGKREFVVARADSIPGDDLQRRWVLSVWQAIRDDAYAGEWQIEILGVRPTGNGVSVRDLTGDGRPDLAFCAIPDLYVFAATGADAYRPIWHTPVDLTYLPLLTDLDGNGRAEIVYNRGGFVRISEWQGGTPGPSAPGPISAMALPPNRVLLSWSGPGGATYRLYRGTSADSLRPLAQGLAVATRTDTLATGAPGYYYAVTALDGAGRESSRSPVLFLPAGSKEGPSIRVDPLTPRHLAVLVDAVLDPYTAGQPRNYTLMPDSIPSSSADLDQDGRGRRVLLGFDRELGAVGRYQLYIRGVRDTTGLPIGFPAAGVVAEFAVGSTAASVAPFDLDRDGAVGLTDFFLFAEAFGTLQPRADFSGDGAVDLADFFLFAEAFGGKWTRTWNPVKGTE